MGADPGRDREPPRPRRNVRAWQEEGTGPRRSSPRCWPTSASRSRSSSASSSPARRRCWPRRSTRSPTPATRACSCSAATGPGGQADEDAPLRLRPRALLLGLHRGARAVQPRRRVRHLRGHREDPAPARDRVGRGGHRDPPVRHRPRDVLVPHRHRGVEQGARRRLVVAVHPPVQEPGAARSCCSRTSAPRSASSSRWAPSSASLVTDDPIYDGIGTLLIGILLTVIAVILAIEMKSLLMGETADPKVQEAIRAGIEAEPRGRAAHPPAHAAPRPRRAAHRRQGAPSSTACR